MSEIILLAEGYSVDKGDGSMRANCSCVLVKDESVNVIVDTMTAWDGKLILDRLRDKANLRPEDIQFVVNTHSHQDHTGNNNLFLNAKHVTFNSICQGDLFESHNFEESNYAISPNVQILHTPGHTSECISVRVTSCNELGTVVISGDLFEKEEDIKDPSIWISAGSFDEDLQRGNRSKVAQQADYIIPGHGTMFKITGEYKDLLSKEMMN